MVFRCESATYAMITFGRWMLDAAIEGGKVTAEGERGLIDGFVSAFVGG